MIVETLRFLARWDGATPFWFAVFAVLASFGMAHSFLNMPFWKKTRPTPPHWINFLGWASLKLAMIALFLCAISFR